MTMPMTMMRELVWSGLCAASSGVANIATADTQPLQIGQLPWSLAGGGASGRSSDAARCIIPEPKQISPSADATASPCNFAPSIAVLCHTSNPACTSKPRIVSTRSDVENCLKIDASI